MKRSFTTWSLLFCFTLISSFAVAQQDWPKTISASNGDVIKIYQPQPESYSNNIFKSRAAISVIESGKTEPVFGTWWSTAQTAPAGDGRTIGIQSLQVTDLRFPSDMDDAKIEGIKSTLQNEVPKMGVRLSESDVQNALNVNQQQTKLASNLNNNPPKVFYTTRPSMLVLIDGTPKLQMNNDWGVEAVVNSPFTIVKNNDGRFYLYGGKRWFTASDATGPYSYVPSAPGNLQTVQAAVDKATADNAANTANSDASANRDNTANDDEATAAANTIPQIIVSTEPAELIQSNGEPNFSPIEGTGLLYVKNSGNDIFMNVNSQQYYVLLAGRWYKSGNLNSSWQFINSSELPADFAKIPKGSTKDNVLASVAGTEAANDAVMDAQVPQTAKVDRNTASTNVTYDGNPQFENIDGTHLQYSQNSSASVLRYRGRYYTVDNGVWFESGSAEGPWVVATQRPEEVDMIPPSYPVYNMKYVDIYDVTSDYVYMGYTPGYLNNYIYGSTIVYGTGYYYRPWYGRYYYPRACTWGFGMGYNPWYGWSVGLDFSFGWFNIGLGGSRWNYWGGGWWGPRAYRPAYFGCGGYYGGGYRNYGYYGGRGRNGYYQNNRTVIINRNYTNNVYQNRRDVITSNNRSYVSNRGFNNNRTYGNNGNNGFNRNGINNPNYNNNGFNNRGRQMNNSNPGYNNNNRMAPGNNNNSRPYNAMPGNNYNRPQSNNNNASPNPGRVQPGRLQQSQPQQQQYNRPQQQRTFNSQPFYSRPAQQAPARVAPQQQQRSFGGGGGVSRPSSGGGGGRSSGGGGGGGGSHGGRRG